MSGLAELAFGSLMVYMGLRKLNHALGELRQDVAKRGAPGEEGKGGRYDWRPCPGSGKGKDGIKCRITEGGSIERRAKIIAERIRKDSLDPRIRKVALAALTEKCGDAWCTPVKDGRAEIKKLYDDSRDPSSFIAKSLRGIEGIFHHVRENVRYTKDHATVDTFQSAYRTLEDFHAGDCDDATITLGAMLRAVGYPVKLRIYWLKGDSEPGHIALMANADPRRDQWMVLDATVERVAVNGRAVPIYPGWEASKSQVSKHRDFPV